MTKITQVEPNYKTQQSILIGIPDGPLEGTYQTIVQNLGQDEVSIRVPQTKQLYLPIRRDQEIELTHYEAAASFEGKTKVRKRLESHGNPIIVVEKPDSLTRIQRRTFLRVPCSIETQINILKNPTNRSLPRSLTGQIVDISGGGVKLDISESIVIPEEAQVELTFTLPHSKKEMSEVFAEIIRIIEDDSKPGYFAATKFVGLTENQRHDIIQYVFKRQRELN